MKVPDNLILSISQGTSFKQASKQASNNSNSNKLGRKSKDITR